MKEAIVETAGKAWQFLGQNGEIEVSVLAKHLNEKNDVVCQSLGWLACEDKIVFSKRKNREYVSLMSSEMDIFKSVVENMSKADKEKKKPGKRTKAK